MANKYMDSTLLDRAIIYAVKAHANTERRDKGFPYIVHPMEAMAIAATITPDQEVLSAAALHDVVEDTDCTIEELRSEFGNRIADLVESESDKYAGSACGKEIWRETKQAAIERLAKADRDSKIVALGDKLSNMRAIAGDFDQIGNKIWERFHAPEPQDHEWRYRGLAASLSELSDTAAYKEFVELIDRVFTKAFYS